MMQDDAAVCRQIHVELQHRNAKRDRVTKRRQRIFGTKCGATAVCDYQRFRRRKKRGCGHRCEQLTGQNVRHATKGITLSQWSFCARNIPRAYNGCRE